jgi:peptidoglycan-N-acetylglucosamine deacetylase
MSSIAVISAQPRYSRQERPGVRQLVKASLGALLPRRLFMVSGARAGSACLTFDDGPHPQQTPRLLDVLAVLGVPATFFLIGKYVELYPDLVRRIVAEGHAVGHHTFHHSPPQNMTAEDLITEIRRTDALFRDIVGYAPRLFRPPWGKLTASKVCRLWAERRTVVLWNSDPKDGAKQTRERMLEWFRRRPLSGGDIVLMHDDRPHAADVLPEIVPEARARRVRFTTPLEWIGLPAAV